MKGRAGVGNNERWWHWRYFGCLMLAIFLSGGASVHSLTSDGMALLAFKEGLKDPHHVLHNWRRTDENPCFWTGVQCNLQTKRVEILNLPRRHLVGTISPEIGKLDKLRRLGLHNNQFYGTIPSTIGNSTDLRALYLRNNVLSGAIPPELGMLQNLKVLDVSGNTLTGSIPASLGNLSNLVFLNLSSNSLIGSIPSPGALVKFTSASFIGNLGLCGDQLNQTCETSATSANGRKTSKVSNSLMVGALGTVAASLCLSLLCFWGFLLYNKFGSKPCAAQVDSSQAAKLVLFHGDLPYTSIDIIKKIEQLDYKDVIGAGGFGMVYRLVMDEGSVFAVKKIGKGGGSSSERLFDRELEILGSIKHRNLVNLRGYCNAPSARLLIYDYLSCGSLDELLHEKKEGRDSFLNWGARLNIAIGAARGLAYLHHDCTPCIIHRDIKSSNILLDDRLEPHVSDFGLAKLLEENDSHITTIVAGTFGYLAPEYMQNGRATAKSDVYSYGVVLLELLSGKRPTDVMFIARGLNIVGWASGMIRENRCLEIFDPYCRGAQLESMEAVLQVAAMCIRARPEERPSMAKVVKFLEAELMSPCPSDFYDSYSE